MEKGLGFLFPVSQTTAIFKQKSKQTLAKVPTISTSSGILRKYIHQGSAEICLYQNEVNVNKIRKQNNMFSVILTIFTIFRPPGFLHEKSGLKTTKLILPTLLWGDTFELGRFWMCFFGSVQPWTLTFQNNPLTLQHLFFRSWACLARDRISCSWLEWTFFRHKSHILGCPPAQ